MEADIQAPAFPAAAPGAGAHETRLETELAIPWERGSLRGTLRQATGAGGPLAIIVPGSGAVDRNGDGPGGLGNAMYRKLAAALGEAGISTLRIDKRGQFGSAADGFDPDAVLFDDYVGDLGAWVQCALAHAGRGGVWLIGHSEGGLVALAAAGHAAVGGVVLLSAPGQDLGSLLVGQLARQEGMPPDLLGTVRELVGELKAGRSVAGDRYPPLLEPLFRPSVQPYLMSVFGVDPACLAERIAKPLLIVSGGRDLQVGEGDAARLRRRQPAAGAVVLPLMNHVLVDITGDTLEENIASYTDQANAISSGLAPAIAAFVLCS